MKQKMKKVSVVSLSGVSKNFEEKEVLRGITFDIKQGEIISLLGPSGCGKTTILRLIAGFESLDGGVISIMGKPVAGRGFSIPPDKRSVGMVFQDYALFPHMTVAQNVLYGLKGFDRERQKKILSGMLRLSGLSGYGKRYPHQLSGGEQQRVAVARA
ncbi:MAG: ABC transporter ATP-binding protein, partial [Spirochaetes bacterium]|nr:ABC transporter ATP-binding protein [Spirochaetota bacterium]